MLKKYRPRTPGTRKLILVKHDQLTRVEGGRKHVKPEKSLLRPKKRTNGRNNKGRITCRHRGGGHKRRYRVVDFVRDKEEIPARVASIEYDPNRSAYIALLNYKDGEKRYIIAPDGLKVGDEVRTGSTPPYAVGCCMRLKDIPEGSAVHNIELYPGRGGQFVRSAGLSAQHMGCSGGYAKIRLPSGEVRSFHEDCKAVIGEVSNKSHSGKVLGKAGRSRWMGRRPTVRGVAMNPVDHPHGGGEGKSKGNIEQSFSGVYVGMRTRSVKKSNKFIDTDRRKK